MAYTSQSRNSVTIPLRIQVCNKINNTSRAWTKLQ